jgi:hypothetical protein
MPKRGRVGQPTRLADWLVGRMADKELRPGCQRGTPGEDGEVDPHGVLAAEVEGVGDGDRKP